MAPVQPKSNIDSPNCRPLGVKTAVFVVVVAWCALFLPFIGRGEVFQVSEGREGVVVREILDSGNYVLPLRNGEIVPSKPILFHWLGALTAQLSGQYSEWELRFPSAVAGLVILLLPLLLLSQQLPVSTLFLASALLFSMSGFYQLASDGRVDMVFNAFVVALILLWVRKPERPPFLLMGVLAGLAVLTKGPLGVALPGLIILSICSFEPSSLDFRQRVQTAFLQLMRMWRGWLVSLVACLVVALPWYYLATERGSAGFVQRQLFFENFARFIGGEGITAKPFWFYIPAFFKESLPVGIIALGVIARGYFLAHRPLSSFDVACSPSERRFFRIGIIWLLSGMFFLSLSTGKRSAYLVPLLPGFAIAFSVWLMASRRAGNPWRGLAIAIWVISALSTVAILAVAHQLTATHSLALPSVTLPPVAGQAVLESVIENQWLALTFIIVVGAVMLFCLRNPRLGKRVGGAYALFAALAIPAVLFLNIGLIAKGKTHSYKQFALTLLERLPQDEKLNFVKTRKDESFDGLFFYYGRHVTIIDPTTFVSAPLRSGLYVARRTWLQEIQALPHDFNISELFEGGRRTDRPQQRLVVFRVNS